MNRQVGYSLLVLGVLTLGTLALFRFPASGKAVLPHPFYAVLEARHEALLAELHGTAKNSEPQKERKVVAILLYPGFTFLDAAGPTQALHMIGDEYKIVTVAKQKGEIASDVGVKVAADYDFSNAPIPDVLIIPGGVEGSLTASKDPQTLAWIQKVNEKTTFTTSVCTGAWVLAAAGVLKGIRVSTYWAGADYVKSFGAIYTGNRYTLDGKYLTSAGASSGVEMGIALVARLKDEDAAKAAELAMEYDPQVPFAGGTPAKSDPELVKLLQEITTDRIQMANK